MSATKLYGHSIRHGHPRPVIPSVNWIGRIVGVSRSTTTTAVDAKARIDPPITARIACHHVGRPIAAADDW